MTQHYLPPRIHVLAKPTGAICNLACSYCFFLDKELLYPGSRFRMSDEVLENYIRQLIAVHRSPQVTVAWQGGEPTLMGIDFYRRAIKLQEKYRKPGMTFENTMQTNGTLLDDEWCLFFKENDFLIGISIDGPRELHNAYRVDKKGEGSFDRVMRGLRLLQKHGVEYNVLATVNRRNADYPLEVYRFLRDEAKTDWIQFIPVVERINEEGQTLYQKGNTVSDRSVQPEQFGSFLSLIFDEWVRNDVGRVFVQTFEASARRWLGMPSCMCVFEETCGMGLALEHNGDLYSCDHFVEPEYLLGNIMEKEIGELAASEKQYKFGQDKRDTLPQVCRECDVLFACMGECPKNRFLTTTDGEPGLNYLCEGWKAFFRHIDFPMQIMTGLIRRGYPAPEVMRVLALEDAFARAGRNDPCPCGSGLKFKRCHGLKKNGPERKDRKQIKNRDQPQSGPVVRF
ncbi:anaerobic sulfatase maturase [Methanosarcina sp. 1.H.A.2.2]|uniref:anaerobic sulfatase maturase n=1 Tax=Methanosarcina sp. 1.H.A.2.2 TaxID=1483601 RepID=UPI00062261A6|nr:anaerobic sulfatase maturase [Methanosarcina sp. 1.H.A.2.2]KKH50728.1 sulfatase maturase [Methanosarcina sp. 1.H.A.2.2]